MRLKSDLLDLLEATADARLDTVVAGVGPRGRRSRSSWPPRVTPGHYERERPIQNLEAADRMPDVKVFHAGTTLRAEAGPGRDARIVTDGGRVLNVTALGDTLEDAQARAYEAARTIKFPGAWYRRDIAGRTAPVPAKSEEGGRSKGDGQVPPGGLPPTVADRDDGLRLRATSWPTSPPLAVREDREVAGDVIHLEHALQCVLAHMVDRRRHVGW